MLSRKRPAEGSPDTRRLTCCEDLGDIIDGRPTSARKGTRSYAQQAFDTVLIKQIIGSLPPYKRERVMRDLECMSATPKKKLFSQLFSPGASQRSGPADSYNSWLMPDASEPASVSKPSVPKPSPCHLARGSYVLKCASHAVKHSSVLPAVARALKSPRPAAVASPRRRGWQGKQPSMKKLNPGVSVIGGSAKLTVSVCQ